MAKLKDFQEADFEGKKVLARFDFNVPLGDNQEILDTSRIDLALPTIRTLLEKKVKKIILMSHLGRPKGKVVPSLSLAPVAQYLAEQLDEEVTLTEGPEDSNLKSYMELPEVKIVLLENLRFHPGEEKDDEEFARLLAERADIFVNDAFGAAHRKHASVHKIIKFFPQTAYPGPLMMREIKALKKLLEKPERPFVAIMGGAKVSDKIGTIERLMIQVDRLLIGGAMAYPFLKAKGIEVGKSLCHDDEVKLAQKILKSESASKLLFPSDHIIAKNPESEGRVCNSASVPADQMGLDIGPETLQRYGNVVREAKTIFWNGPMGLFENEGFEKGTMAMAKMIAETPAYSVVGGGDSVNAVKRSGLSEEFSHISTGGGASLEFIERGDLPGLRALKVGVS